MALATELTPVSKAERALGLARTPEQTKEVEALAAAAKAWAKEQGDLELTFDAASIYIKARCKTTELIDPSIKHGDQRRFQGDGIVTLEDYGFTRKQWNRRKKELEAYQRFGEYQDECIEKGMYPTPYGLVGFYNGAHVSHNSGNDEWYTPPAIIELARSVMGGIDLDPASSEEANKIVKAEFYCSIEDDGLVPEWFGRVWMNPPYSQPLINKFSKKLVTEFTEGRVEEACVLVNNATDTTWFQNMLAISGAVCFIKGRVKFIDEDGNPSGAPLQGQAVLYFGANGEKFESKFSDLGIVVWREGRSITGS